MDYAKTLPVDTFTPNPFGLYQVHGNVWEWVEDCWNETYAGAPSDGRPWTTVGCARRVLRGGSWDSYPTELRAASRRGVSPDERTFSLIGLRVARPLSP